MLLYICDNYLQGDQPKNLLASEGERRDTKRRVDRHRELPVTVIWGNRTTS